MKSKQRPRIEEYSVGTTFNEEEVEAVRRVLMSGESLTRGEDVELFEKEFAEYAGARYAISMSSCGAALRIANQITHLTSQDEVICQANAFWVTIVNLLERNVKFKVADIDPKSLNISPESVKKLINSKTKAIYVMHHGGNPTDLNPIREIAEKHDLVIIEDAAHAAGSNTRGKKLERKVTLHVFLFLH